jgi:hypothetical protein
MNGMLQHHDIYREGVARHQEEARQWARDRSMGRQAQAVRKQPAEPGHSGRLMSAAASMKALLLLIGNHAPKRAHRHV